MSKRTPLHALYAADAISPSGNAAAQIAIPWFALTTTGNRACRIPHPAITQTCRRSDVRSIPRRVGGGTAFHLESTTRARPRRHGPAHETPRGAPGSVVLAVFAEEEYGSATDFGLMVGVLGGAALAGALANSAIGHRLPRRRTFLVCFSFVPVGYLALATAPSLPVALAALAIGGFAAGPINPLLFTVQTEIIPAELRGRVFGAVRAGAWAAIPLGILLGGVVVAAIGPAATFLAMGVLLAAVVGYGFFNPAFREMDHPSTASMSAEVGT